MKIARYSQVLGAPIPRLDDVVKGCTGLCGRNDKQEHEREFSSR